MSRFLQAAFNSSLSETTLIRSILNSEDLEAKRNIEANQKRVKETQKRFKDLTKSKDNFEDPRQATLFFYITLLYVLLIVIVGLWVIISLYILQSDLTAQQDTHLENETRKSTTTNSSGDTSLVKEDIITMHYGAASSPDNLFRISISFVIVIGIVGLLLFFLSQRGLWTYMEKRRANINSINEGLETLRTELERIDSDLVILKEKLNH